MRRRPARLITRTENEPGKAHQAAVVATVLATKRPPARCAQRAFQAQGGQPKGGAAGARRPATTGRAWLPASRETERQPAQAKACRRRPNLAERRRREKRRAEPEETGRKGRARPGPGARRPREQPGGPDEGNAPPRKRVAEGKRAPRAATRRRPAFAGNSEDSQGSDEQNRGSGPRERRARTAAERRRRAQASAEARKAGGPARDREATAVRVMPTGGRPCAARQTSARGRRGIPRRTGRAAHQPRHTVQLPRRGRRRASRHGQRGQATRTAPEDRVLHRARRRCRRPRAASGSVARGHAKMQTSSSNGTNGAGGGGPPSATRELGEAAQENRAKARRLRGGAPGKARHEGPRRAACTGVLAGRPGRGVPTTRMDEAGER